MVVGYSQRRKYKAIKIYFYQHFSTVPPKYRIASQLKVSTIDTLYMFTSQFSTIHLCVDTKTFDAVLSSNAMESNNLTFCRVVWGGIASEEYVLRCTVRVVGLNYKSTQAST